MHERTSNLLGATALALTDLLLGGATVAATTSPSGAAALVVLSTAPGLSVTELGRRVGLSQSAAARMVDGLQAKGLVERRASIGKWVAVYPTGRGERAAADILSTRHDRLSSVVAVLDDDERQALTSILGKLLTAAYAETPDGNRLCRLCDRASCTADSAICPVGEAERNR